MESAGKSIPFWFHLSGFTIGLWSCQMLILKPNEANFQNFFNPVRFMHNPYH